MSFEGTIQAEKSKPPGLLLVCRQTYEESIEIFYKTASFDITGIKSKWLTRLPKARRALITSGVHTFDAILASPASSRTSLESWNSTPRRIEYGFQRPAPIKQYRRRRETGELLAALPEEVLGLILDELKKLHLKPGSTSCATCMMRDLCSVAMAGRGLLRVAQVAL